MRPRGPLSNFTMTFVLTLLLCSLTLSATAHGPTPHPSLDPVEEPGRRDVDIVAILVAGAAIVVAGGAGIWIYRVIRKGL